MNKATSKINRLKMHRTSGWPSARIQEALTLQTRHERKESMICRCSFCFLQT